MKIDWKWVLIVYMACVISILTHEYVQRLAPPKCEASEQLTPRLVKFANMDGIRCACAENGTLMMRRAGDTDPKDILIAPGFSHTTKESEMAK